VRSRAGLRPGAFRSVLNHGVRASDEARVALEISRTRHYNASMRIAPGKVVGGRVELDAEMPEGAAVTVIALEGDETFEVDRGTEDELLQAIILCDQGRVTPFARLLEELRQQQ
jgi:hypothetical protein